MSTRRLTLAAVLALLSIAASLPALAGLSPCGDNNSPGLQWRCYVIQADEIAPAENQFDGACVDPHTIQVAPWRIDTETGLAVEFVISGRTIEDCTIGPLAEPVAETGAPTPAYCPGHPLPACGEPGCSCIEQLGMVCPGAHCELCTETLVACE